MNTYHHPLRVRLGNAKRFETSYDRRNQRLTVATDAHMSNVRQALSDVIGDHDYILIESATPRARNAYMTSHDRHVIDTVCDAVARKRLPVVDVYHNHTYVISDVKPWSFGDDVVSQDDLPKVNTREARVTAKRALYGSQRDWQQHQAAVLDRILSGMGLSKEHQQMLMSPGRGLDESDLAQFHDWNAGISLSPSVLNDDLVGIPGVSARDCSKVATFVDNDGTQLPDRPVALTTTGMRGIAIPMRNVDGVTPRFQIATDATPLNVRLKLRTADNKAIDGHLYYDKAASGHGFTFADGTRSRTHGGDYLNKYLFKFQDGSDTELHVADVANGVVTFEDKHGGFKAKLKDDVLPVLKERGYDIPNIVDKAAISSTAKYIWLSSGSMIGDPEGLGREISPAQAGIIRVREPQGRRTDYTAIVCEGALKGVIAAKYLTRPDKDGVSLANTIAGDESGIILVQVPGVARAFVRSAEPVYHDLTTNDGRPAQVTRTLIAMDADGRTNALVARGVNTAERQLKEFGSGSVRVMSWDPTYKGLDDALLGVSRGELTIEQLGVKVGSAQELFPVSQATQPVPVDYDGKPIYDYVKGNGRSHDDPLRKKVTVPTHKDTTASQHAASPGHTIKQYADAPDDASPDMTPGDYHL